ncbi:MAG: AraC family transcriptional regulator [bacterium]
MKKELRSAFNSRQYMLSEDFEVFYYSDLNFRPVGSHAHDYFEFYFFVEGAVTMELTDRSYRLQAGDMLILPPGIQHRALVDGNTPYRRFVFWTSRAFVRKLSALSPDYGWLFQDALTSRDYLTRFDPVAFNTLKARLFALLDEIHARRFGREAEIALMVQSLILWLARQRHPAEPTRSPGYYDAITAFIETHLDEELTLDRLAGEFYISKYYISHLFQENTGLSVHQFILKRRLDTAKNALQSGKSAAESAALAGFSDYTAFYRAFRKEYGCSPREYRGGRK